jgi:DNA-binding MarR family transcriptional regulator
VNDVGLMVNRLCHLMVALEESIGDGPNAAPDAPGIDTPRLGVLLALDLFGPMRPREVGMLIGLSSSVVTKLATSLEHAAYLSRSTGGVPGDRRAVVLELTGAGRVALERCNALVRDLGVDLVAALSAVDPNLPSDPDVAPTTDTIPGSQPVIAAPALAELFRFVAEIDQPITATVGHLPNLHPADPRGLLLLSEIHVRGPVRTGAVPMLIDRSRGAGRRLVDELITTALVERVAGTIAEDRRIVVIDLTPIGLALVRGTIAAVAAHMTTIRPAAIALSRALAGERQSLGAAAP